MGKMLFGRIAMGLSALLLFAAEVPAEAAPDGMSLGHPGVSSGPFAGHGQCLAAAGREIFAPFAEEMLMLVNQERGQRGLPPLRLSKDLMDAAAIRAEELTQVFSHTRPNGESCTSLIENGAYTVGENIAAGHETPAEAVAQWMESPGHRANILNEDYTELGVGYTYREDSEYLHYWVQIFRRPMSKAIRYR